MHIKLQTAVQNSVLPFTQIGGALVALATRSDIAMSSQFLQEPWKSTEENAKLTSKQ